MKQKQFISNALLVMALFAVSMLIGCGGGGGTTVVTTPVTSTTISGVARVPSGTSGARVAERSAAAVSETVLTGATVKIGRMKSDGTIEYFGLETTTRGDGTFSIQDVPEEENMIIVISKGSIVVKGITSITDDDVVAGGKSNIEIDSGSTLVVAVVKDIVVTANNGKSEDQKIAAKELPSEIISEIHTDIDTAVEQEAGASVDISQVVSGDSSAVATQLSNLENSANGAAIKTKKNNATSWCSLRVRVIEKGANGEENVRGNRVVGANVIVTIDGATYSEKTNEKGDAFFRGITPGSSVEIEVAVEGYELIRTSQNLMHAAVVTHINVFVEKTTENQAPIAKAGKDQSVEQNSVVALDGSESYDPDGDTITYAWTYTGDASIVLTGSTTANASFSAVAAGTYTFSLVVNDGVLSSDPDTVTVTVSETSQPGCSSATECDDGNSLTIDACGTSGECTHTSIACNTDADCDDSNAATADTCANGGTVSAMCSNEVIPECTSVTECDDGNALTIDNCSTAGNCEHVTIACNTDADCDDSNTMTEDACTNGGTISAACSNAAIACNTNTDCDDGNVLTLDTCANGGTATASCSNTAIACNTDQDCDDGSALTLDACTSGGTVSATCTNSAIACNVDTDCDDGNALTLDACANGGTAVASCTNTAIACNTDQDCDDSDSTTNDTCTDGGTTNASCSNESALTILVAEIDNRVIEIDTNGNILWTYNSTLPASGIREAERLANGNTLICEYTDALNGSRVIEVDQAGTIVWEYAIDNSLTGPMDADRLSNGNTLIAIYNDGKFIEVDAAGNTVWEYIPGGQAEDAERLSNGNTIIGNAHASYTEIVEIDSNGSVLWSYDSGNWNTRSVDVMSSGNILIVEQDNSNYNNPARVREIDSTGSVVWEYTGAIVNTGSAEELANGHLLIADYGNGRVFEMDKNYNIIWEVTGLNVPIDAKVVAF